MSMIQSVNYQIQPNFTEKSRNNSAVQSFGKAPTSPLAKDLADVFSDKMMTKRATFYDFLALKEGEIQNQIINNLFTATLAPTMIAFNPFCDKPKKDKEYLAFRQFVSAGIALSMTAPVTILVNKQIATIGSEGMIKSIDIRMAPHKDYLKSYFKKELKQARKSTEGKQNFEKELGLTDKRIMNLRDSNNILNPKRWYYDASLENLYIGKKQAEARSFFVELISKNVFDKDGQIRSIVEKGTDNILLLDETNKPVIRFSKGNDGNVEIIGDDGKVITYERNHKVKTSASEVLGEYKLERKIPGIKTFEQLKDYIFQHNIHRRTFGDFMRDNFNFEFYNGGKIQRDSTLKKTGDINIVKFIEAIGLNKDLNADSIRKVMGKAYQAGLEKDKGLTSNVAEAIGKLISRSIQHETGEHSSKKLHASLNQFFDRTDFLHQFNTPEIEKMIKNGIPDDADQIKAIQLQELMNRPVSKVMEALKATFIKNGLDVFKDEKIEATASRYVKKFTDNLTENFKNTSKLYGIAIAAVITLGTCSVLNWTYPRIIEKFFPQLLVKDKPSDDKKGGAV